MLELDHGKLPQRISDARHTILDRAEEILAGFTQRRARRSQRCAPGFASARGSDCPGRKTRRGIMPAALGELARQRFLDSTYDIEHSTSTADFIVPMPTPPPRRLSVANMAEKKLRCPYCVVGGQFHSMNAVAEDRWICQICGHIVFPNDTAFRCPARSA